MIGLQNKILRSPRLTYRLLQEIDKPALAALLRDEKVTGPAGFLPAKTDAEFDEFYDKLTQYNTGVAVLSGDALIGYFHVNKYVSDLDDLSGKACVDTGFVIGKDYQQKGYGTEMLMTLTDYLLESFYACFAGCFIGNAASQRTIEKCGYQFFEDHTMYFAELKKEETCHIYIHR